MTGVLAIAAGANHSLAIRNDGTVWAWGSNANGALGNGSTTSSSTPVRAALPGRFTAVAGGRLHSVAVRANGAVFTWGQNDAGQLGTGSASAFSSTPVQVVGLPAVPVYQVAAGAGIGHTLALLTDGRVFAWGSNARGQLGNGTTGPFSATPVPVTGLNLH